VHTPRTAAIPAWLTACLAPCLAAGLAALSAGCPDAASGDSSRPKEAEAWYRRAQHEYREADFAEAHDSVAKALHVVPDDPQVRILSAEVALASLDYAEVLRLLKGVQGTEAARLRGRALWYKGDLDAAADELENMLNDPEVKDEWAKATSKLARQAAGRTPFDIKGMIGSVEMVVVNQYPYFVVPVEIGGESALAMIATGSGEVVVDSATHPEPSWVSLRFEHLEVRDVPAVPQDLSQISKDAGAPIKALLGVNLLRHLNATFDFTGHQFVVRSFAPPNPPRATRLDLFYARGGGMIVRSSLGSVEGGPFAAFMIDTHLPFAVTLDDAGWKKVGVDASTLRPLASEPGQRVREGSVPLLRLGALELRNVPGLSGIAFTDLEKATQVDLDGLLGAGLLYRYRCTFADGGRVLWLEDDSEEIMALLRGGLRAPPPGLAPVAPNAGKPDASPRPPADPLNSPLLPPSPPPKPLNEREAPLPKK
jgi:tetratricopeptide (TPR) repeat protein